MELIHPVFAGPVLDERELQAAGLSREQQQVIRAMFDLAPEQPISSEDIANVLDGVKAITGQLEKSYGDLEAYEESLVPKGYHPVNKEPLSGGD